MENDDLNSFAQYVEIPEVECPRIYVIIVNGAHKRIVFEKQNYSAIEMGFYLPVDTFYLNKMSKIERKIEIMSCCCNHAGFFGLSTMGIRYQVIVINFSGSVEDARAAFPKLKSFRLYTPADIVRNSVGNFPDAITETALKVFTNYCLTSADKDLIWLGKQLPEGTLSLGTKVWDSANESVNPKE